METEKINPLDYEIARAEKPEWSDDGKLMNVYKVPLDLLYYNDDNGRIATWISGYQEEHPENKLSDLNREAYNSEIEKLIKMSGKAGSYEKTKRDIFGKGQLRPGLILTDGRVVDGNRRFTVLRDLNRENPTLERFSYFECFIVDAPKPGDESAWKKIKKIERRAQFDVDEKVDYDPIEKLVEAYEDLLADKHLLSENEYKEIYHMTDSEVREMKCRAQIMIDYLDFVGLHNQFYIVRSRKLDGPINELWRLFNSLDVAEWNRIRSLFYVSMYQEGERSDRSREIRDLVKAYRDRGLNNNFETALAAINRDLEFKQQKQLTSKETNEPSSRTTSPHFDASQNEIVPAQNKPEETTDAHAPSISRESKQLVQDVVQKTKENRARRKPIDQANSAYQSLNEIDLQALPKMSDSEKEELKTSLLKTQSQLNLLKEILH